MLIITTTSTTNSILNSTVRKGDTGYLLAGSEGWGPLTCERGPCTKHAAQCQLAFALAMWQP